MRWEVESIVAGELARGQFLKECKGHIFKTGLYIVDEGTTLREVKGQ